MRNLCPACGEKFLIKYFSEYKGIFMGIQSLLICNNCELIFAKDIPPQDQIDKFYNDQQYYGDQTKIKPTERSFYNFSLKVSESRISLIAKHIDLSKNSFRCLDIGTGNGAFVESINKYSNIEVDLIEPDKRAINLLNSNYGSHFYSLDEILDKKYDLIVVNQVLEHVSEPITFVKKITNLLKNDGYLYIDTPFRDCEFKDDLSPHVLFWNINSMKRFFDSHGFNTVFIDSAGLQIPDAKLYFRKLTIYQKLISLNYLKSYLGRKFFKHNFLAKKIDENLYKYGGKRVWIRGIFKKSNA